MTRCALPRLFKRRTKRKGGVEKLIQFFETEAFGTQFLAFVVCETT